MACGVLLVAAFKANDPEAGQERRDSIVAPAQRSEEADQKASRKRTGEGLPVHSFQTLLRDLATLTKNTIRVGEHITFDQITRPSPQGVSYSFTWGTSV